MARMKIIYVHIYKPWKWPEKNCPDIPISNQAGPVYGNKRSSILIFPFPIFYVYIIIIINIAIEGKR